jgi:hypothetical protein
MTEGLGRFAFLLLASLAGCADAGERLVGSWEFDPATFDLVKTIREWPKAELEQRIKETRFDLVFTKDTVKWDQEMGYGWGVLHAEARYTVKEVEGNRVTIETALTGPEAERFTFSVQGDRLRFGLRGRSIILRRK